MGCALPHPKRAPDGLAIHPDLEVIGSESTEDWARCRKCGAWVWLATDVGGKWEFVEDWELDRNLAERAFVDHDANAAAQLLVSMKLPQGPIWQTSSALLSVLRAVTPNATDADRSLALDAAHPDALWAEAANMLRERVLAVPIAAPPLAFAAAMLIAGRTLEDHYELGRSLVIVQTAPTHATIRIDASGISERAWAGPIGFLSHTSDAFVFSVGDRIHRIDAAGDVTSYPPSTTRYSVTDLEGGDWLFVPDDDTPTRNVEFRRHDSPRVTSIRMAFAPQKTYPCPPKKMGAGWIVSGCVDDTGAEQALTLFDASFEMIAQSRGERGQRLIEVVSDSVLWCETSEPPYTVERWERRGEVFERTFAVQSQSWIRIGDGVVIVLRDVKGGLSGYGDDGALRFQIPRNLSGARYLAKAREGLLVYDLASADTIDPRTGKAVAESIPIESASLLDARDGTLFMRDRNALHVLGEKRTRLYVGPSMRIEKTCGDSALLRDEHGECLVVGSDATIRGRFSAQTARFSVVGTSGGPYVVEAITGGSRVRIARFGT